jgi:hypothetical protein
VSRRLAAGERQRRGHAVRAGPAAAGALMRLYGPSGRVLRGNWPLPLVTKVG